MDRDENGARTTEGISAMAVLPNLESWRTAQELVKETVRRAILGGELAAGTRLIQADLAAQLGVSTTPVREALRDLAGAGLITLDRNRGGVVRELNWHEIEEIGQIQEQLRPLAIELALRSLTEDDLREAEVLADQMDEETDLATWVDLNLRFHFLFHEATGLERLTAILKSLEEGSMLYVAQAQRWHPEIRRRANEAHRAFLAACRAGDVEAAAAATLGHATLPIAMTDEEERSTAAGDGTLGATQKTSKAAKQA